MRAAASGTKAPNDVGGTSAGMGGRDLALAGAVAAMAPPAAGSAGERGSAVTAGSHMTATAPAAGSGGTMSSAARMRLPSGGCGKSQRPDGGIVNVSGSHIYWFPPSYDGNTPMALIMAFHAAGNGNDQLRRITTGSALEEHFVMAFPKSSGNGWSLTADSDKIDATYKDLLSNYCIDTSRVFAMGHSSGAQLIVQLMCKNQARYHAIAPVASSAYCQRWDQPIPSLIIHGANDKERANTNQDADGTKDLAPYLASNRCTMETKSHEQAGCSSSGTQVAPGCVAYEGCAEPTIWCHHNDPAYSGTNHGWPCFANDTIDAFFTSFL